MLDAIRECDTTLKQEDLFGRTEGPNADSTETFLVGFCRRPSTPWYSRSVLQGRVGVRTLMLTRFMLEANATLLSAFRPLLGHLGARRGPITCRAFLCPRAM